MSQALHYLVIILEVLLIFNLIIVVHELGHFLAARWRGLVVEEFGVWFGKPLWRKKFNGVWYSLGTIPAGGFVKLPQLAPMRTIEGAPETPERDLPTIKPLDKIIVAFAGPLFSFLLALALACVVWAVGKPTTLSDNSTVIGTVFKGGPADQAGLKAGDEIVSIDGKPVKRFIGQVDSVLWGIASSEGEKIRFVVKRDGQELTIDSGFEKEKVRWWERDSLRRVLIGSRNSPEVAVVTLDSIAAKAGLKVGDMVTHVNGQPILNFDEINDAAEKDPAAPVKLTVQREGQNVEVTLPPRTGEKDKTLGVAWGRIHWEHPTPWKQVTDSVKAIGNMLGAVTSQKSGIRTQHFSGPIGIMNLYRMILDSPEGWRLAIGFSVFFNVNLALINMLPLPVLDGGHITLGLLEIVRRRPITNIRFLEYLETACTLAILSFIVYVTFFDLSDILKPREKAGPAHNEKVAPTPAATPAPAPNP